MKQENALLCILTAALLLAVPCGAQVINAASCSASDVQNAFNAVTSSTTTVNIPACAGTNWTSQVTLTIPSGSTSLSVLGAGSLTTPGGGDVTNIVDDIAGSSALLLITAAPGASLLRVAGITFKGGAAGTGNDKFGGMVSVTGASANVRFDHDHFNTATYSPALASAGMRVNGCVYGVVDHNIFDNPAGSVNNSVQAYNQGSCYSDSLGVGDQAWAHPNGLGSSNFIFIENNTFNSGASNDCTDGGTFVFRFNTFNATTPVPSVQTHPTGGAGRIRGCRAQEVYENTFTAALGNYINADIWISSGTALIWGNTIPSSSAGGGTGYKNFIELLDMRANNSTYTQTATPNGWGYCGTAFNGTGSNWDGNNPSAVNGYPCLDQPGRGQGDLLTGGFTLDGSGSNDVTNNATGCTASSSCAYPRQAIEPVYEWMDAYSIVPDNPSNLLNVDEGTFTNNVDYYLWCNASSQSGCTSFNGTVGTGSGTLASRPSTCTTGVAYWATDQGSWNGSGSGGQGELFKCTATNTWTLAYTPYTYPHPLVSTPVAAAPTFSPVGGTYSGTQSVTISTTSVGASIYYTTNGSTPTTSSTVYSGPVTVASSETLSAVAGGTGYTTSSVASAAYNLPNVFNVNSSMSASAISSTAATAAASAGSVVQFAAGTYNLASSLSLPCTNGVIYTGPIIGQAVVSYSSAGVQSFSNIPTAVMHAPNAGTYAMSLQSNGGSNTSYTSGCTIQYFDFNGTQGGVYVPSPMSGYTIQNNVFENNNPSPCGSSCNPGNALSNIYVDGSASTFNASGGSSWFHIAWNIARNNCAQMQVQSFPDNGGYCALAFHNSYTGNELLENNFVNQTEQGFKWAERSSSAIVMNNDVIQNNNIQGNSRIGSESQQGSNGGATGALWQHNAFYQPTLPGFGTFGISATLGLGGSSTGASGTANDNALIAVVPSTGTGSGQHYAYALELWGIGFQGNYNLIQGGNTGGPGCAPGQPTGLCTGWAIVLGPSSMNMVMTNNYASGLYISQEGLFSTEDGGSLTASGIVLTPNTTTATSTTVASVTPIISPSSGSFAGSQTVTISDTDTNHAYSFFYTLDGSTPCIFGPGGSCGTTRLYTGPFTVNTATTVKAIAHWGRGANQGIVFPSFGWVPSAVTSQTYSSGGTVALTSVTVSAVGGAVVEVGNTLQFSAACNYSDGSSTPCNTVDIHGNVVTGWTSSSSNLTVNGSGLGTGITIGTANVTATVTGGLLSTPPLAVTISASPLTLTSLTLATAGGVGSMTSTQTNQLIPTCHYNDGSSTLCGTVDNHGNIAAGFLSSAPASATVNATSGLVSGVAAGSTTLTATVTPAPSVLGTNVENVSGFTENGFINEIYGVTGSSASGYTPGNCHITLPAGITMQVGQLWTCLLVLGTPTTQNASALCTNTFTITTATWPGGDIVISMASCPNLPPDTGYWVGSTTNQTISNPGQGFSNCGSSCSGSAPVFGSGTYPYWFVANTFGNYTALPTTLSPSGTPGQQVSQFLQLTTTPVTSAGLPLTITAAPPTLMSAYLTANASTLVVGQTLQMAAKCHYSSGPDQDCTVADIYGDAVTLWSTSDATKATIGAVGSSNAGLVTAVAVGAPSITARISGTGPTSTAYPLTITNPAVTLTGVSLSTTGGVTGLFVGSTNQLIATCMYSDGSSDNCTTTDAHGNAASSWTSTTPANATVNATTGLVTGVAVGATTFTAKAGSFTSPSIPLTILSVPTGIYTIRIKGPVKFSGRVRF